MVRIAVHTNTVARNNAIMRFSVFIILIFSPPVKNLILHAFDEYL